MNNNSPEFNFTALENESLFSIATRICICGGYPSLTIARLRLLGNCDQQLDSFFPPYIPQLSVATSISKEALIHNHSVLNFFKPFIPSHVYNNIYLNMLKGSTKDALSQLSLVSNHLPIHSELKYCKTCASDDCNDKGFTYWRRQHQLPGVTICTKHNIKLTSCRRIRKAMFLPPIEEINIDNEPSSTSSLLIANTCEHFLHNNHIGFSPDLLKSTYLQAIEKKGLASSSLRVKQKSLRVKISDFWRELMREKIVKMIFADKRTAPYPMNLFYSYRSIHHPLKHILMILFLFEDLARFYRAYAASSIHVKPTSEPMIKSGDKEDQTDRLKNSIAQLLKTGYSLRQVAMIFGVSFQLVKTTAIKNGIAVDRRPSKIFNHERKEIWKKLYIGKTTQDIAREFKVSVGAIEHILSAYPILIELRKRIRFFSKRRNEREKILKYLKCHTSATRNEVLNSCQKAYIWLFKNDSLWLYDHLPPEIPRSARYKRAK